MNLWHENDQFIMAHLLQSDPILENVLATSRAAARARGWPDMEVSPTQGKFLHLLAAIKGATRILELGTFVGYSTIWLARALPANGQLVSLEFDPDIAATARQNIADAGLCKQVDIRQGDAAVLLEQMIAANEAPFDMIFIDADKPAYPTYLRLVLPLAKAGTVIVSDNIIRDGELCNANNPDPKVAGVRTFIQDLGKTPGLASSALQTVGIKGYDGFSVSVVQG